jgi:hypothetical protein
LFTINPRTSFFTHDTTAFMTFNNSFLSSLIFSPYAYQFGLGKRADGDDIQNYDDEIYDKADLNLENLSDGGYFDNKDDIDVVDYGYGYGLPRGE